MPFKETDLKSSVFSPISGAFSYSDYEEKVKESQRVESEVGAGELWEAAFGLNNTVASLAVDSSLEHSFDQWDSNYEPDYEGYEDYAGEIALAKNQAHEAAIKSDIDRQNEYGAVIAASGWKGVAASMAAGIIDPTILLPGAAVIKGAKGYNLLRVTGKSALIGGGAVGAYEGILHQTQETRTIEETAINIGAGAFLSGVLGNIASRLSKSEFDSVTKKVAKDLMVPENPDARYFEDALTALDPADLSAAAVKKLSKDDLTLKGALGVQKLKFSPLLRMTQSEITSVRRTANQLIETPLRLKGEESGLTAGPAAETNMGLWQGNLAKGFKGVKGSFDKYRKNADGKPKYDIKRFKEEIAAAMRRGDEHVIPEVQEAARILRRDVYDPLKNEAIALKLLPDDVEPKFADSYLTRMWSREKILQNPDEFDRMIEEWAHKKITQERRNLQVEINKLDKRTKKTESIIEKRGELRGRLSALDDEFMKDNIQDIVDQVRDTLTGIDSHKVPTFITPISQGPLKEKLLDIEDIIAEPFLENDIGYVTDTYVRKMGADVELTRNFGDATLKPQIDDIKSEASALRKKAKTAKEKRRIDDDLKQSIKDIELMRDVLRGHHRSADYDNVWARGSMALRDINFVSKLGGVTISSFADVAGPIMKHGISRSFGDLIKFRSLPKLARTQSIDELRESGLIIERVLNDRLETLADVTDPYARNRGLTKYTGHISQKFSTMTGINHWNDMMKSFAGMTTQNRVMKGVSKQIDGSINKKESQYLKHLGLSDENINEIYTQFKKHGEIDKGFHLTGISKWDDTNRANNAARALKSAIRKEANSVIVTKGVGDIPSFMNSEAGKLVMQFKTFVFAAHNRILIRGLQDRDAAALSGVVTAVAMGMMVSKLKAELYNAGLDASDSDRPRINTDEWTSEKWAVEGLDRSGLLAVLWEINNTYEKLGGQGVTQALGEQPASRYMSRNVAGTIAGPSVGTVSDMAAGVRMSGGLMRGDDIYSSDIHALRRIMPFQNLVGIRSLFDIMEEGAKDATKAK